MYSAVFSRSKYILRDTPTVLLLGNGDDILTALSALLQHCFLNMGDLQKVFHTRYVICMWLR